MELLWLLLIPLVWVTVVRLVCRRSFTLPEAGALGGGGVVLMVLVWACVSWYQSDDVEILNGQVTSKTRDVVHCRHSYDCNCYTTTDSKGNRTRHCSTCYDHSYDVDWDVATTVGDHSIETLDRQGLMEPPRWTSIHVGDPAAATHHYTNYLLAAADSLFKMKLTDQDIKRYAKIIPAYHTVYDYYQVDHVYVIGASVPNAKAWNQALGMALRTLGPAKQANINLIFVAGMDRSYKEILERAWVSGKKNDINIILGVTGTHIDWVESFTFGKSEGNEMLQVQLRDQLEALHDTTSPDPAVKIIDHIVRQYYTRLPMAHFQYLSEQSKPSATAVAWIIGVFIVLLSAGTWWFLVTDLGSYDFQRTLRKPYTYRRYIKPGASDNEDDA